MMRKLTEQEERQIQHCYAVASRLEQLGQVEAAQSERQRAQNLRHRYEHDNETAEGIFNHRTDEAMKYIPYKLRNQQGEIIAECNMDAKPVDTMYGRDKVKAVLYAAGSGEFAVDMPMIKTRTRSVKRLQKEDRFFDSFGGFRIVTPIGISREMFMLDSAVKDSTVVIMHNEHGPVTVHDLWVFANRIH